MSSQRLVNRVIVPIITPMNKDGSIDFVSLQKQTDMVVSGGVDGVVVAGTTGEGNLLTIEEKKKLFDFFVTYREQSGKDIVLVAGSGEQDAEKTVTLMNYASLLGFDAGLCLPIKTSSQDEIIQFYEEISQHTLPIIGYHIPFLSGTKILPKTIAHLVNEHILVGVKDSSQDAQLITEWKKYAPAAIVFSGGDKLTAAARAAGSIDSSIPGSANLAPKLFTSIFRNATNERGKLAQKELDRVVDALISSGNFFGGTKIVLAKRGIIGSPYTRTSPQVSEENAKKLLATMSSLKNIE